MRGSKSFLRDFKEFRFDGAFLVLILKPFTMEIGSLLTSATTGGLAGALFGNSLGMWRRFQLHRKLKFESPVITRPELAFSVRVRNGHTFPLTGCAAYITLKHELSEIETPAYDLRSIHGIDVNAYIRPDNPAMLTEARLCWAVEWSKTEPAVDIYPAESRQLEILKFVGEQKIAVFSETRDKPYRVFLLGGSRSYSGTLKIVCKEIRAKEISITLPMNAVSDPSFPAIGFLPR